LQTEMASLLAAWQEMQFQVEACQRPVAIAIS
jgi:hypothetical protein